MAKRFVDTEIWHKDWFSELSLKHKVLVKYIFENCDCAGIWDANFRLASFLIGEQVTKDDIDEINSHKELFIFFDDNKIFIKKFIEFQYGNLSEFCKPHKPVIEKLKKYGLYENLLKGFENPSERFEEKEKEKEQEKEKEKDKEQVKEQVKEKEEEKKLVFTYLLNGKIKTDMIPDSDKSYQKTKQLLEKLGAVVLTDRYGVEVT